MKGVAARGSELEKLIGPLAYLSFRQQRVPQGGGRLSRRIESYQVLGAM